MADDCEEMICKDDPLAELRGHLRNNEQKECPLDRRELGISSWSILHTFAAYYPVKPTQDDKQSMLGLLKGFRNLYPCTHCRAHFQKDYDKDPPNVQSQEQVSVWICMQHNRVNRMLGKKRFECSFENLTQRWKTGCNNDEDDML